MTTIFVGGSRRVSRLPAEAKDRLNNIIHSGFDVLVGDASGADKAVQRHLADANYPKVKVYCSGGRCRNNLGNWPTHNTCVQRETRNFQFYASKDREMARDADFGFMIWDGESAGTVLNVLRLIGAGKKAMLLKVPEKRAVSFKTSADWSAFLAQCSPEFRHDLRERATPEEWRLCEDPQQAGFLDRFDAETGLLERQREQGKPKIS